MNAAELEAVHQLTWRLERGLLPPTPDAHVHHAYEPLPLAEFLPGFREADRLSWNGVNRRFLDIGCGTGTKLVIAHYMGWLTSGIDRHEPYLEIARELIPEADLILSDAFDVEFFDANVVYMCRPMVSASDMDRLEAHVLDRVRPGTVCFFAQRRDPEVWVV